jgi:hypothetical protein
VWRRKLDHDSPVIDHLLQVRDDDSNECTIQNGALSGQVDVTPWWSDSIGANGLQPHRLRSFKLSQAPEFVDKMIDIMGLYVDPFDATAMAIFSPCHALDANSTRGRKTLRSRIAKREASRVGGDEASSL